MKVLFVIFIFLSTLSSFAQEGKPLKYSELIVVDSLLHSDKLFARARQWFTDNFRNANDVLQIEDKQTGELMGNGTIRYSSSVQSGSKLSSGWIRFKIKIEVKTGKYRYEFYNFDHRGTPNLSGNSSDFLIITDSENCPYKVFTTSMNWKKWPTEVWKDIKVTIDKEVNAMTVDLKERMGRPGSSDNW